MAWPRHSSWALATTGTLREKVRSSQSSGLHPLLPLFPNQQSNSSYTNVISLQWLDTPVSARFVSPSCTLLRKAPPTLCDP